MERGKNVNNSAIKEYNVVNSVVKAVSVLNCFTQQHSELTLAQISGQLKLPKSTALNLIRTLESCNLLQQTPDKQRYTLGYKVSEYAYIFHSSMPVLQRAVPFLEDIQIKTGEIVYLVTHAQGRVLYLESVYPSRRMASYSVSGRTHPMHCTGCGKAMMAYLPEEEIDEIIRTYGLERRTSNTITDPKLLKEELAKIRKRGYSLDIEEETPGVKCIGVAIRDSSGYPLGGISISGTMVSIPDSVINEYAELLSRTSNILASLGGSEWFRFNFPCSHYGQV